MIPTKTRYEDGEVFALTVHIHKLERELAEAKAQVAAVRLKEAELWNSILITAVNLPDQAKLEANSRLEQLRALSNL